MEALQDFDINNPKTYAGIDPKKPGKAMFEKFGL